MSTPRTRTEGILEPTTNVACLAALLEPGPALHGFSAVADGVCLHGAVDAGRLEDLLGLVANERWDGVVLSLDATMTTTDDILDVSVATAVHRSGLCSVAAWDGHDTTWLDPTCGLPSDLCHRMLGLATPSELRSPGTPMVAGWLAEIIDLALDPAMSDWSQDWAAVADIHPLRDVASSNDPTTLGHAVAADARRTTWDRLLRLSTVSRSSEDHLSWLDAGSFARLCLSWFPPIPDLLAAVDLVVPAAVARQVHLSVASSQLDGLPVNICDRSPDR